MIGIYFNDSECDLLIPLLVSKISSLFSFPGLTGQDVKDVLVLRKRYEEMLGRIYVSKNIGVLNSASL